MIKKKVKSMINNTSKRQINKNKRRKRFYVQKQQKLK